jgi:alkylation response protein AidB-like acyl-CoA dehydrogenase
MYTTWCGQSLAVKLGRAFALVYPALAMLHLSSFFHAAVAGLYVPEEYGGSGLGRLDGTLIFEGLSYGDVSTAAYLTIHNMVAYVVRERIPHTWLVLGPLHTPGYCAPAQWQPSIKASGMTA